MTLGCLVSLALVLLALAYGAMLLGLNAAFFGNISDSTVRMILYMVLLDLVCAVMVIAAIRAAMHCFAMLTALGNRPLPQQPPIVRWGLWLILIVWTATTIRYILVESVEAGLAGNVFGFLITGLPVILAGWVKFTIYQKSDRVT